MIETKSMHRGEDDSGIACTLQTYSIVIAVVCLTFRPLATLAQDGYPRKLYEDICAAMDPTIQNRVKQMNMRTPFLEFLVIFFSKAENQRSLYWL
jgi:hypothetical protein